MPGTSAGDLCVFNIKTKATFCQCKKPVEVVFSAWSRFIWTIHVFGVFFFLGFIANVIWKPPEILYNKLVYKYVWSRERLSPFGVHWLGQVFRTALPVCNNGTSNRDVEPQEDSTEREVLQGNFQGSFCSMFFFFSILFHGKNTLQHSQHVSLMSFWIICRNIPETRNGCRMGVCSTTSPLVCRVPQNWRLQRRALGLNAEVWRAWLSATVAQSRRG